ncbi:MAG: hypothetical protein ACRD00_06600 [Thermoanaerobaculia bacterium]
MDIDGLSERKSREWVSFCLRAIREAAETGLDEQEATRRARRLNTLILTGRISPDEIELDNHQKDVLCALVYRVLPEESTPDHAREVVADFIRRIRWEDDLIGEKQELVTDCAAALAAPAGARALETELADAFVELSPLVHSMLVDGHGLKEAEAGLLERDLAPWFSRFRARPGSAAERITGLVEACRKAARDGSGPTSPPGARLDQLLKFALLEIERQRRSG